MPKKKTRTKYPPEYKRQVVKRALAARKSGEETITAIAKDLKLGKDPAAGAALIQSWLKAAPSRQPKASEKKAGIRQGRVVAVNGAPAPARDVATIDRAIAEAERTLSTLRQVRDAYRQVFGG
jgi:transposase-like protein